MTDEESPEHKAHMKIDALHERIQAAGLTGKPRERPLTEPAPSKDGDDFRRVSLSVINWQAVMVDELAAHHHPP